MISFVVPAYNEEELLGATLDAIHTAAVATGQDYEIVVADDASSDRTAEVARAHEARVVSASHRQIAATRNAGAREARGDLLIFVDADTIVNPDVVRAAFESVRAGAIGGGAGVQVPGPASLVRQGARTSGRLDLPESSSRGGLFPLCHAQGL